MRNFFQKIMLFMQGRYGMDALNGCLLVLAAVIWTINIFIFPRIPHLILMLLVRGSITVCTTIRTLSMSSATTAMLLPVAATLPLQEVRP